MSDVEIIQINVKELHQTISSSKPSELHGKVVWTKDLDGQEMSNWYYQGEQCLGGKTEFEFLVSIEGFSEEEKERRMQAYEYEWAARIKAKIEADFNALPEEEKKIAQEIRDRVKKLNMTLDELFYCDGTLRPIEDK